MIACVRRVVVVGTSGAGKTRLAKRLAAELGVPHVELDALYNGPGWRPREAEDFRRAVERATAGEGWVVDGNYRLLVQDIVTERADTLVWLDLSRPVVMWQILARTLGRLLLRRELWNGNRERWRNLATLDPQESIVLWAWTTHGARRERYEARLASGAWGHLHVERLRTRRQVARFLSSAGGV